MRRFMCLGTVGVLLCCALPVSAQYVPLLDEVEGIPGNAGSYLILPAFENTNPAVHQHAYFIFPKYLQLSRTSAGDPVQFGMTHVGFSLFPNGKADRAPRANVTAGVQAVVDDKGILQIQQELTKRDVAQGLQPPVFPTAVFEKMQGALVINGLADSATFASLSGGYTGATLLANFTVPTDVNRAFVLKLPANAGQDASLWGVMLTGTIKGYGNRVNCSITARHRDVYNYFAARASTQAFWGIVKADVSTEVKNLDQQGVVDFGPCRGKQDLIDKIVMPVWNLIVKMQDDDGNPLFAEMVKNTATGTNHPESGSSGWGFQASARWAQVTATKSITFNFNVAEQIEWDLPMAMLFNTTCNRFKSYIINQTDPDKPCVDIQDIENIQGAQTTCVSSFLQMVKSWQDQQLIDDQTAKELRKQIFHDGCGWTPSSSPDLVLKFKTKTAYDTIDKMFQAAKSEMTFKHAH